MRVAGIFLLILMAGLLFAQPVIEGGNVTQVDFHGIRNSTNWDGFYGEVVLGAGGTYTVNVVGNQAIELNVVAQEPPCTYSWIRMHIVAVNGTAAAVATPLSAGNLALLDAFIGSSENGSATFETTSTFQLTYGEIAGVPTTYTMAGNATSPDFRMGYLNDALGNFVFVAEVVGNRPNWNGSTSDYQIMLPNDGGVVQYTLWVDVDYACAPTPPSGKKQHELYIYPVGAYSAISGETFNLEALVENRGDYREDNVLVYIKNCPAGFSCGSWGTPDLIVGEERIAGFPISVEGAGQYVLMVCAKSDYTEYCREFILNVLPECESDADCGEDEYCDGGTCTEKKEIGEECDGGNECKSGICEQGVCAACEKDSDCKDDEFCSDGVCEKVECPCGVVKNHACTPYECCADADCAATHICIGNVCVEKELGIILIDGLKVEGETGLFQVVDNMGEGVPGAQLSTDKESATADGNGYASIAFPYTGIIYADAEGYPQAAALYDIMRLGFILVEGVPVAGEETVIRVVDSRGNPIVGATVTINGETYITDKNGEIRHVFREAGIREIGAQKAGYRIKDAEINVVAEWEAAPACYVPFVLNWFEVPMPQLWMLWVVSIALALFNFIFFRERVRIELLKRTGGEKGEGIVRAKREIDLRGIAYSAVPLALALPNFWILNICFMFNVVALQAIGEIGIVIRRMLEKKAQGKGEKEIRKRS